MLQQDPRRLDPRRSSAPGVSPSAKDEDTTMTGSPVAENELVNHLVDVKREPLAPVMRDPREVSPVLPSPVGLSAPILAQVKAEPVEEKPSSAGTRPLSPPAASVSVPLAPPQPVPLVASVKTEHPAVVVPPFSSPTSGAAPAPTISKDGRAGTSMSSSGLGGGMGSAGIPVNVPVPTLPVISLTEEQQVALGKAALVRILEGHKTISAAGGDGLRIALLARLVAQASCFLQVDLLAYKLNSQFRQSLRPEGFTLVSHTFLQFSYRCKPKITEKFEYHMLELHLCHIHNGAGSEIGVVQGFSEEI